MPTHERKLSADTSPRPSPSRVSWPAALLAAACAAAGVTLASHYPLSAPAAMLLFMLAAAASWWRPHAWLVWLPALLPVVGFAPWTGWITFEELDLLVLAVATGGYARRAWRTPHETGAQVARHGSSAAALIGLTVALFAASTLLAMARGFADAGGFSFGWFQGYREPMNSVRLAKPVFAALLLWPLWHAAQRQAPDRSAQQVSLGMMLGLLGASLAALWERLAFTGLLNFSTDYRTTALFWEMHVGGAALDGYLALTMPFAVRELLAAQTRQRWAFAAAVTALGTYACITTFSRGVYLAVPVGLGLMWALRAAQQRRAAPAQRPATRHALVARACVIAAFVLAAAWMFPSSGYRGMLALTGALCLLLPLGSALRQAGRADLFAGASIGAVLATAAAAIAWLVPKGPYVVYALGVLFGLAMLGLRQSAAPRGHARHAAALAWAGYLWVLTATALVAWHWGGDAALQRALPAVAVLLAAALASAWSRRDLWPQGLRWQGDTLGIAVLAGGLVAAFGGGAYMGDRFATTESDLSGRLAHWRLSAAMLDGLDDWMLGKGLGRYPDSYAIAAPENLRPGDLRLQGADTGAQLKLTGGGQLTGDPDKPMSHGGDILRLTQRIALPAGRPHVSFDVRAPRAAELNIAVCTKHLLYPDACLARAVRAEAKPGQWQHFQVELQGEPLSRGAWYAPRLVAFTFGVDTSGGEVEATRFSLTDSNGRDLLSNGGFSANLAHWFFTSDRSHLPWHAKNMALHVLFDQGVVGLSLLCALAAGALWRTCLGNARQHALAPSLAGATIGFIVVGLFDSLLDVPRVAFVWYSLVLMMLSLHAGGRQPTA